MECALHTEDPVSRLDRTDPASVRQFMQPAHPVDLAAYIEDLPPDSVKQSLLAIPLSRRVTAFRYLRPERQVEIGGYLSRSQFAEIVTAVGPDDRADLFNHLSPDVQQSLVRSLAQTERDGIRRLAAHSEGTAGAIMTSEYAILAPELTPRDAIEVFRQDAPEKETIYRTYVCDRDRRLIGTVRLQDLILASPNSTVADLMRRGPVGVHLNESQEDVARKIGGDDVLALPVVDDDGRILGIITYDDAQDALRERRPPRTFIRSANWTLQRPALRWSRPSQTQPV